MYLSPLNQGVPQILAPSQLAVKRNVLIGAIEVIYQDSTLKGSHFVKVA